jgi:hypothetical protein
MVENDLFLESTNLLIANPNLLVGNRDLLVGNHFGQKLYLLVGNGFDGHDSTMKWLSNDVCFAILQEIH